MFSWFPLYLPLRHPVDIAEGATVTVQFWRQCSSAKVTPRHLLTPSPRHLLTPSPRTRTWTTTRAQTMETHPRRALTLTPQVWYEWALLEPQASPIHNPNGRSYHIGL